jgi:glycine oxidase
VSGSGLPDVLIVGGGAIGCAIARRAALAGLRVRLLERATPGAEASSAAAGMLSPLAEAPGPGPFLDLLLAARAEYPAFAAALREETAIDVGYDTTGTLYLSLREEDDAELEHRHAWQSGAGLAVERLTAHEARALEPAISPAVRCALRFPGDHQVDSRQLSRALWLAARCAGAEVELGVEAVELLTKQGRATGVRAADGTRIAAGAIVIAGGSWSGGLRGLPRPLPVEPVHGQLLALQPDPPLLRHVVDTPRGYLVPRASGRIVVGATSERVGHHKAVTSGGVRRLLNAAVEAVPALDASALAETWSGLRPGTPDGLPILGRDPDFHNLLYATGHYRNGILLTPLTAEVITSVLLRQNPAVDLAPYSLSRFS